MTTYLAAVAAILTATYILYQYQLGAVGFFLLSIFFFSMAKKQFFNPPENKKKRSK